MLICSRLIAQPATAGIVENISRFLIKLFEIEVPEIEEGVLEIRAAARDPGFRAKLQLNRMMRVLIRLGHV